MNALRSAPPCPSVTRGRFAGVLDVVRFNRRAYVAAGLALLAAMAITALRAPGWLIAATWIAVAPALFWTAASLIATHWVYDRSELYHWHWVRKALGFEPKNWANLHAGFDVSTAALKQLFPQSRGQALDIFDPAEMTESSIAIARQAARDPDAAGVARCDRLPFADGSLDTVFLILAAHEIRRPEARARFFDELARALQPGGQVLLVEHLRDLPNFIAYGPGFAHFHSRRIWLQAAAGHFALEGEHRLTPFLRVFRLRTQS